MIYLGLRSLLIVIRRKFQAAPNQDETGCNRWWTKMRFDCCSFSWQVVLHLCETSPPSSLIKLLKCLPIVILDWFSAKKETKKWRKRIFLTKPGTSLLFNVLLNRQSWSEKPWLAAIRGQGRHRWLYILSDSLIVPAPLNMHCTYLGIQTNSSQAAGYY